jgi:hypothetical protein
LKDFETSERDSSLKLSRFSLWDAHAKRQDEIALEAAASAIDVPFSEP